MLALDPVKVVAAFCLGSFGLVTLGQTSQTTVPSPAKAAPSTQAVLHYGQLPLSFEPNRGQTSTNVQWLARGPEYTLYLAGPDAVLQMNKITPAKRDSTDPKKLQPSISSSVVRMSLIGAQNDPQTTGEEPQSGKANYFTGNDPAKWQHDVPMYGKVHMQGVYPGMDLLYYGHRGQLEYDFVVAPGADPSAIQFRFDGAKPTLAANGDLVLPVEGGPEVRFNKPVVYQMLDGARQPVESSFAIAENKAGGQISFHLGAYDHSRELVIDPTLLFVGVLGTGNFETQADGMAVDAAGEIILTGFTGDVNFPVTAGAFQTICNQYSAVAAANNFTRCGSEVYNGSAFVTKISADGTSLVYSTYLHGLSGLEAGQSVAADAAGDAIVLGETGSSDFPVTSDAIQPLCMPYYYPIGVAGGSPSDFYQPAAQHCDGNFAGGGTEWVSGGPTLFIAKLNPSGSALIYSTFFGGTNPTYPSGLALDSSGNIYFTSFVQGAELTNNIYPNNGTVQFPVTASAYQSVPVANTPQATTLSELSADGHTLLYSTFFAATSTSNPAWVQPLALAVGPNGIAYVGGWTYSDAVPTTPGSFRPACVDSSVYNGGIEDGFCEGYTGFLAAFDTTQSGSASLKYATYIGGPEIPGSNSPQNQVLGLAADSANNMYVTGLTVSPNYPTTTGAFDSTCTALNPGNGWCNATGFLTKIDPTGSTYLWSTYFGGNNDSSSQGQAVALDAQGRVYLYGYDSNYTYDLPLVNPLEPRPGNGSSYAFVATFSADGTQLLFSTPLGNQSPSAANTYPVPYNGMALDANGNIYFAAYGSDSGTFITTPGTYATTAAGGSPRSYFGKISPVLAPTATTLTISPSSTITGQTVTFTATVAGTTQATPVPTGTVSLVNNSTSPATPLGAIDLVANGSGTFTTSALAAGSYSVTATYSADSNYNASSSSAMALTITEGASQTISFSPLPTVTYGVSAITLGATASSGLPVSYSVSGPANITGSTLTVTGTGSVTVTASQFGNSIYAPATAASQSFTVSPAVLTVTANNASRVYGAANPAFGYTVTGFVNGDTSAVISGTATETTTATSTSSAGTYPITFSTESLTASNYTFAYAGGTLTVSGGASQTIAFASLASVAYGKSPITLGATASSGLAVSYTVTGPASVSGSTLTITGAGTVTVTATQSGNSNYAPATSVSQGLNVIPAKLTVTANNVSRAYGAANPAFSYTVTGFVDGDTLAVVSGTATETTTATSNSTAGTYPITFSTESLSAANYTFSYVIGTLTISGGASQTITFASLPSVTLGTSPITLTATASSGLAVGFASLTPTVCTVSGSKATILASGTCTIQATQAGNSAYTAAPTVSQSFTVLPAATSFTIVPTPAKETVDRGVVGAFILQLNSVKGFNGQVTLTCSGGPIGSSCTDFPMTVKLNGTAYAVSGILFPKNSTPGSYTIKFTGVSGSLKNTATAMFTVK